jgi:hypothetical protein
MRLRQKHGKTHRKGNHEHDKRRQEAELCTFVNHGDCSSRPRTRDRF